MTAEGYDEAVEGRSPYHMGLDTPAENSPDTAALSEADPISTDELALQEAGRDLRPDTITPSPELTSTDAAMLAEAEAADEGEPPVEDDSPISPSVSATEASAPEIQISSEPAPVYREQASDEKDADGGDGQDASPHAE
jgi:hypothetical protein